jgi:hypothetical protein
VQPSVWGNATQVGTTSGDGRSRLDTAVLPDLRREGLGHATHREGYVFEWKGSTTVTHTVNYVCTPLFRLNASADAIAAQ